MLHRPRAAVSLLALASSVLAVCTLPPSTAVAAAPQPVGPRSVRVGTTAPAGELTAVLQLAQSPAQRSRLSALASSRLHPAQARARQLAATSLRPAPSTRSAAERFATRHRLRGRQGDDWSITVSAEPARLAAAFGSTLTSSLVHGRRFRHAVVAPSVPTELRGAVSEVVGLDERPAMHPRLNPRTPLPGAPAGTQDGDSLRKAYSVPPAWRGKGVTVATLNLSGWDSSDLFTYARLTKTPTTSTTLTQVSVAPATAGKPDAYGGDFEVALDAETLLATAPAASQRAYFSANSATGVTNTMNRLASDAEAHLFTVFTTSWGACERYAKGQSSYSQAVARMVAAGVTVFAASGDAGAYDCADRYVTDEAHDNTTLAVDFPASDPNVVGTGGTTLPASSETAWSSEPDTTDPDLVADYRGDGSGGGFSRLKRRPSFQVALGLAGSMRSVPDVAMDADPATGLAMVYGGHGAAAGGTSLASPGWAGFTAAALSATTRPTVGFGNILPTLYANPSAFRDITTGANHNYRAGPGYDQVTGLGVPRWSTLGALLAGNPLLTVARPYTTSTTVPVKVTPPRGSTFTGYRLGEGPGFAACSAIGSPTPPTSYVLATATQGRHALLLDAVDSAGTCHVTQASVVYDTGVPTGRLTFGLATGTDTRTRAVWSATDTSSPVTSYDVVVARRGSTTDYAANGTRGAQRTTRPLVAGGTYVSTVRPRDAAGNVGPTVQLPFTVPNDDRSVSITGSWTRSALSYDFLGSHLRTATKGATASFRRTGRTFTIGVIKTPSAGYLDVFVDGVRTGYDLYATTTKVRQQLVVKRFASDGTHMVEVVVRGGHRSASSGSNIYLDSFTVSP